MKYGSAFSTRCPRCHQYDHADCNPLPLETPSHNGTYRGSLPVRVLPIGASGDDLKPSRRAVIAQKHSTTARPRLPSGRFG